MSLQDSIPRNSPIAFPGLFGDWQFTADPKLLDIGNGIYWYGVLIALGLLLGLHFCMKRVSRFGMTEDNLMDAVLWSVPLGILGARLYYIIFYFDLYRSADGSPDFGKMIRIWDGGLAIYGGLIVGAATTYIVSRRKGFSCLALMDDMVMGVQIAQCLGRWGNFMNREAFGSETQVPWRMRLWAWDGQFYDVHPTFLYESLWSLAGFLLIWLVVSKHRRFDGQNTLCYLLWYGLGRVWIEGLRADSLHLFGITLFGAPVRVSQALSAVLVLASATLLAWNLRRTASKQFPKE